MKLGEDTKRKVGLWLMGECGWLTVGIRGAGLVDPVLYFLLLQYFGGGEKERPGRKDSLWNSCSVNGHTFCFAQLCKLGLSKPVDGPTLRTPTLSLPACLPPWEIHHPYSTPRTNKLETHEAVKFCFINLCIYMSDLNFFWSWGSYLSLQLAHCSGTWQVVGVQSILRTSVITEGPLFQEQSYSPGWVEVAYLDRSIWQSVIRQLWLHLVYWFLTYFGCLSLNTDASPRTNKPREPQPLEN